MRFRVLAVAVVTAAALASCGSSKATTSSTTVKPAAQPTAATKSCAEAVASGDVDTVLAAWRNARITGSGAEGCMSDAALRSYCSPTHPCSDSEFGPGRAPGPICLYECHGYRVRDISLEKATNGTTGIYVQVVTTPDSATPGAPSPNEAITVGRGTPAGGTTEQATVILTATSSA